MDETTLLLRLAASEDNFVERKPDNAQRDWRKTIVAFANSLGDGQTALLFIGIGDRGETLGVANADKVQKAIADICDDQCYPPLRPRPICTVLRRTGKEIVAVEIYASSNGPHFSGPAYVRSGSRSVVASADIFEELIARRHDVGRVLLDWKRQGKGILRVEAIGKRLGNTKPLIDPTHRESLECTVEEVNAHFVVFRSASIPSTEYQEPVGNIYITGRTPDGMLRITIRPS
ncbi:MAG TPA: ATP-binding protein [Terriglobia bacterium]|nr:ATP-binding protein [Terriglobia bacterium]